tara:strand:+ start:3581 stop:4801 length:1221 start_codon:yes stop_codon:yes gene_type:complete
MRSTTPFVHTSLDPQVRQIRLLNVESELSDGLISCTLGTYLIEERNLYIALSYTWGPGPATNTILLNGAAFRVRRNLHEFLLVARLKGFTEALWIDQICINQKAVQERNHQLTLMGTIYYDAQSVLLWLGSAADDSDWAMHVIATGKDDHCGWTTDTAQKRELLVSAAQERDYDLEQASLRTRHAIVNFFARAYWSRLWIIQELKLARHAYVLCGMQRVGWQCLQNFVRLRQRTKGASFFSERSTRLILTKECNTRSFHRKELHFLEASEVMLRIPTNSASERLRYLVWNHCRAECADPRDKVYGMLNLATLVEGKLEGELLFQADYNKTVEQVFWDFFEQTLIDQLKSLYPQSSTEWKRTWLPKWQCFASILMYEMGLQSEALCEKVENIALETICGLENRPTYA